MPHSKKFIVKTEKNIFLNEFSWNNYLNFKTRFYYSRKKINWTEGIYQNIITYSSVYSRTHSSQSTIWHSWQIIKSEELSSRTFQLCRCWHDFYQCYSAPYAIIKLAASFSPTPKKFVKYFLINALDYSVELYTNYYKWSNDLPTDLKHT